LTTGKTFLTLQTYEAIYEALIRHCAGNKSCLEVSVLLGMCCFPRGRIGVAVGDRSIDDDAAFAL